MKKLFTPAAPAAIMLFPPPPPALAQYQASNAYLSLSLGQGNLEFEGEEINGAFVNTGTPYTWVIPSADDDDFIYEAMLGYNFFENFGMEVGYSEQGEYQATVVSTLSYRGGSESIPATSEIAVSGWKVGLIGILPLGETFSLFAKAGLFAYDYDFESSFTRDGETTFFEESDDGNDAYYGIGGKWDFGGSLDLAVEAIQYNVDDLEGGLQLSSALIFNF